jgi:hypothetical protein
MSKKDINELFLTLHNFKIELFLSYIDMKFEAALVNFSISWYKLVSYMIEEEFTYMLAILLQFMKKIMKNLMQLSKASSNIKEIMAIIMLLLL